MLSIFSMGPTRSSTQQRTRMVISRADLDEVPGLLISKGARLCHRYELDEKLVELYSAWASMCGYKSVLPTAT